MKFGRNQPRSQPIVRVAHRSHSPCVYPANLGDLRWPRAARTADRPEDRDATFLGFSTFTPRDREFDSPGALPHWNYRVYISGNGISLVSSWMQRELFALSFCLSQTDGRHS
jgi:hypothetical protein